MNHLIVFGGQPGKQLLVVGDVHRGGGGQVSAPFDMAEDVLGAGFHAVPVGAAAERDVQGDDGDIIAFHQLGGEVAGAGGGNFN